MLEVDSTLAEFNTKCQEALNRQIKFQSMWASAIPYEIEIPYDAHKSDSSYANIAQWHTNPETNQWELDEQETVKQFARVFKWARDHGYSLEKKYTDDEFRMLVTTDQCGVIEFYSTRKVVCHKVVVGYETVPAMPETQKPIEEWVCDKIAFSTVEI